MIDSLLRRVTESPWHLARIPRRSFEYACLHPWPSDAAGRSLRQVRPLALYRRTHMTLKQLRVWYDYQRFMSHARSARDFMAVMKTLCELVPEPDHADVVVLHHEPGHYREFLQDVPALRNKYIVGYGVWETDILPRDMIEGCRYVDEIWTPSTF